jgi:hypothetical protein
VTRIVGATANQLRVAKRLVPRRGATLSERFGPLDDRLVFVVGSPRSGTTFLAGAIGSLPGFVDLGELAPVKAAVPELAALPPAEAARRLRRTLAVSRRVGLVGSVRAVEQTPELAHLATVLPLAFPDATIVHIVRVETLRAVRRSFAVGFGSCSFEDPIQDLQALGLLGQ